MPLGSSGTSAPNRSVPDSFARPLRVCLFGTYDRIAHPRIAILEAALRAAGAEVVEAHTRAWRGAPRRSCGSRPIRCGRPPCCALPAPGCGWPGASASSAPDIVLVGYLGHLDVQLARLLAGRRRVALDMFLSVYDTVVLDRASVAPGSLRARLCRLVDRSAVRASRVALLDTEAQVEFCTRALGIPATRLAVVPVGAEPERFPARPPVEGQPLRVLFYGSFIPLHGTSTLAAAIRLLEGASIEAACAGRAIVTADTPAIREAFADDKVVLVPPGDPAVLAATLRALASDRDRVAELGRLARARFERDYAPEPLGRRLTAILRQPQAGEWVPAPRFLLRLDLVRRLLPLLDKEQPVLELGFGAGGMLENWPGKGFGTSWGWTSPRRRPATPPGAWPVSGRAAAAAAAGGTGRPRPCQGAVRGRPRLRGARACPGRQGAAQPGLGAAAARGRMLVSVPAHQARFSSWDAAVGHIRRYEREELIGRFVEAGFTVETFWCYGYPLANLLDRARRVMTRPLEPGSAAALDLHTAESGDRVPARGW
jgi:hypothetical protein